MADQRLFRLRIELYAAAQTLQGDDAKEFWALLEEVVSLKEALTAPRVQPPEDA